MLAFLHKSAISFNILSLLQIFCRSKLYVLGIILACLHTKSAISFNILSVQMICLYGMALYINAIVYRQSTNIVKIYVYASERSERARKCWHFYILKVQFLSIFCRYKWYFVGTNDMLVGTNMYMLVDKFPDVPTKLRKSIIGGGGAVAPPPPPLATLVVYIWKLIDLLYERNL